MVCTKFGWNWPSGSRYEDFKMWKVYDNDAADDDDHGQRTTDKLWSEKLTWAFGSGEL